MVGRQLCGESLMQSQSHIEHIKSRISHNNCQECRADTERRFLSLKWPGYQFVSEYSAYVTPLLELIRNGEDSADARQWRAKFRKALHTRITLKVGGEVGRKRNDSYRDRLGQFPRATDEAYLRRFARRGASTLE